MTIVCATQSANALTETNWTQIKSSEMSMIPFFPSLRPTVGSSICIDADTPCDEESELRVIEKEHVEWVRIIQNNQNSFFVWEQKLQDFDGVIEKDAEDSRFIVPLNFFEKSLIHQINGHKFILLNV